MRIRLLALALVALSSLIVGAQRPAVGADARIPMARAEDVGMSAERLARVKAAMQRYVDRGEVPGVVTLIARRGRVVHFESIGYRDVDSRTPMTPDTVFRLASMTKPIVAAALMTLYEEGEFQLSDPVSKWLPEFQNMQVVQPQGPDANYNLVAARNPITVRNVLTHTSGVQSGGGLLRPLYGKVAPRTVPGDTLGSFVTRLAALPLNFEPGAKWEYGAAGNGLAVTGRLVEVISQKPLDRFIEERILRPLRMNDTYFYLPEEKLARFAVLYKPGPEKKIEIDEKADRNSLYFRERTFLSGTGGLVSTARDYLRFQQMMLNGGELDGVRILGRKTVELIASNHTGNLAIAPNRGPGYGFGLAVSVVADVGATGQLGSTGTYGWGGATCTITFVDPAEELIGIMMTQVRPCTDLNIRRDFQTLAYQAIVGAPRTARSSN